MRIKQECENEDNHDPRGRASIPTCDEETMKQTEMQHMKKLAVNKTSAKRLRAAWGENFPDWVGHTITVARGQVNGKAATLCTPVKGTPQSAPRPSTP